MVGGGEGRRGKKEGDRERERKGVREWKERERQGRARGPAAQKKLFFAFWPVQGTLKDTCFPIGGDAVPFWSPSFPKRMWLARRDEPAASTRAREWAREAQLLFATASGKPMLKFFRAREHSEKSASQRRRESRVALLFFQWRRSPPSPTSCNSPGLVSCFFSSRYGSSAICCSQRKH